MKKPYVGITGFMSLHEVLTVLEEYPLHTNRLIMVGVLASWKSLSGIPNKWPNRYPHINAISHTFHDSPFTLNLIHYHTKKQDTLTDQLCQMTEIGGPNLDGFQLNIVWPSLPELRKYKEQYPDKQLVLQIGSRAFDMVGYAPGPLAAKVAMYDEVADYVLLDPSGGQGKALNLDMTRNYLLELREANLKMGLGIAGGLGTDAIELIQPLVTEFPGLSIDAEGRLRTPEDHLDIDISIDYLKKAFLLDR